MGITQKFIPIGGNGEDEFFDAFEARSRLPGYAQWREEKLPLAQAVLPHRNGKARERPVDIAASAS